MKIPTIPSWGKTIAYGLLAGLVIRALIPLRPDSAKYF